MKSGWAQSTHWLKLKKFLSKNTVFLRMRQRAISVNEFKEAMKQAKIIEYYEDDYPFSSALILGFTATGRPLHAVVSLGQSNEILWVITLHEPTTKLWTDNFKTRRG